MKNSLFQTLKILLTAVVLSLGISYVYAWTAPTGAPPTNNTPEPLNTGNFLQTKTGDLWIDSGSVSSPAFLGVVGGGSFGGNLEVLGNLTVGGTVKVANTGDSCNSSTEGQIKFDGTTFLGCVNTGVWEELTQGPLFLTISDYVNYDFADLGLIEPRSIILTIEGTVSSLDPSIPALKVGGLPTNSTVTIINNGTIVGAAGRGGAGGSITDGGDWPAQMTPGGNGGNGGVAIYSSMPTIDIDNNGTIMGGGGGAGGGGAAWCVDLDEDSSYTRICAAGGGGGGGVIAGGGGAAGTSNRCVWIANNDPGFSGNATSGGRGGVGSIMINASNTNSSVRGGAGGSGGNRGSNGNIGATASVSSCGINSRITSPGDMGYAGQSIVGTFRNI